MYTEIDNKYKIYVLGRRHQDRRAAAAAVLQAQRDVLRHEQLSEAWRSFVTWVVWVLSLGQSRMTVEQRL